MPAEEILVNIRTVNELRSLVQTNEDMERLRSVGVNVNNGLRDMKGRMMSVNVAAKKASSVFRGFRMELLSVMFFGMGVKRVFQGLLNPAMQMVGVFDLWSTIMAVTFMPIAMFILNNFLLPFMKLMLGLPEPVKLFLGAIALAGVALGTFGLIFGSVMLGIFGLQTALPMITALFSPFVIGVLAVVAAVVGLLLLWKNWEKISTKMKIVIGVLAVAIGLLLIPFSPVLAAIALLFAAGVAVIAVIKNWGKITQWMSDKWEAFKTLISDSFIGTAVRAIGDAFGWVVDRVKDLWNWIVKLLNKIADSPFGQTIASIVGKAVSVGKGVFGQRHTGGFIPQDGLYNLKQGETVTPANQTLNFAPTFNVTNTGSPLDIARLKMEMSQQFARELGGLARR